MMDIGASLKTFIYVVSSSLLYPVLILLVVLTFVVIAYGGSFFAEWLERIRLPKSPPEELPTILQSGDAVTRVSHRVRQYVEDLGRVLERRDCTGPCIENLLHTTMLRTWKSMDRLRVVVRVAPALGLIGTLIPMSTGLAALGQGDLTQLSSDLVIAFTTTVIGLALGIAAFFFYTIKRRWIEEDIKNVELATRMMTQHKMAEVTDGKPQVQIRAFQ